MGSMDLHAREARLLGDAGGGDEATYDVADLLTAELAGQLEELTVSTSTRHLAGGDRMAIDRARRLPAGVVDLHPQLGAVRGARLRPASQHLPVGLILDDDVARLPQVAGVDRDVAGHKDPCATSGPAPVEVHGVLRGPQFGGSQGLMHRRLEEAVLHGDSTGQGKRLSEDGGRGNHRPPFHRSVEVLGPFDIRDAITP